MNKAQIQVGNFNSKYPPGTLMIVIDESDEEEQMIVEIVMPAFVRYDGIPVVRPKEMKFPTSIYNLRPLTE